MQVEEKLNSSQHDGKFFGLGPLHEFGKRLDPRLNSILLDHFSNYEGQGSDCPEITMLCDDDGQKGRSDFLNLRGLTSCKSALRESKMSMRAG